MHSKKVGIEVLTECKMCGYKYSKLFEMMLHSLVIHSLTLFHKNSIYCIAQGFFFFKNAYHNAK